MSTALYTEYGELKWEKQTNNATQGEINTVYTYDNSTGLLLNRMRNKETTSYGYDALKRLSTVEIAGQPGYNIASDGNDTVFNFLEVRQVE